MPLSAGTRLGPYEIVALLGAGGMGEVYKARDARLDRTVAIKILPTALANDPDLRARFEREALAIAALDHPHICAVHDVGEHEGTRYLVMQYLDGETLAARLSRTKGPLPLDQALKIGVEIADALDKAHRAGITHRDLKPPNIMLTKTGAKLLDFGLAKLREPAAPISMSGMTRLATPTRNTAHGTILGTLHYMAPEQVEGREADARSDLWALGAVMYEMATGACPFGGDTAASVIGAILKDTPPPISSRQPLSPPALDHVVGRCLEKDPDERWQTAADLMRELRWIERSRESTASISDRSRSIRPARIGWFVAAAFGIATIALSVLLARSRVATEGPILRLSVLPPPNTLFASSTGTVPSPEFALSPDGRSLVFAAETESGDRALWVRALNGVAAQQLSRTEDAHYPFWSPDSRSIAFFAQGKLKRIEAAGGPAQTVCDVGEARGGTWGPGNIILFSSNISPIYRVSASGGAPTAATTLDPKTETDHRWPSFLPDGRHFLFLARKRALLDYTVEVTSIDGGERTPLVRSQYGARYVPSGHILFLTNGVLMAQPFDATLGSPDDYADVRFSSDNRRVAVSRTDSKSGGDNIWMIDVASALFSPLTFGSGSVNSSPVWSPDDRDIFFRSNRENPMSIFRRLASGAGSDELVFRAEGEFRQTFGGNVFPTDVSPDRKFLLFHASSPALGLDIWALPLTGDRTPRPLVRSPATEMDGHFSPDGGFVAYTSDESGQSQVYVQPFPESGGRWQVSVDGGFEPRWRADGRELFFIGGDRRMMAAPVRTGSTFEHDTPVPLFTTRVPGLGNPYRTNYSVTRDGQRFLVKTVAEQSTAPSITVVTNWLELLKK